MQKKLTVTKAIFLRTELGLEFSAKESLKYIICMVSFENVLAAFKIMTIKVSKQQDFQSSDLNSRDANFQSPGFLIFKKGTMMCA